MAHLRERVRNGDYVSGAIILEFYAPGMAQILTNCGCQFVLYDMEHSGVALETLKYQTAACRGLPITPIARPPASDYHLIARLLDIGMRGVMVPMVESAAQAESIVRACRYPPVGRRGAAMGVAHDDYVVGSPAATMKKSNDEILVITQVETERGVENVDAIAATEGVDVIWIGQFDLSSFLGVPGDFESAAYKEAWAEIKAAARRHGKALGVMAPNPEWAKGYKEEGFEMIAAGPDMTAFASGISSILEAAK